MAENQQTPIENPHNRLGKGEVLTCHNFWCNYKTRELLDKCPKCGRPLLSSKTFRILGWVLVFLGGILFFAGAGLTFLVYPRLSGVRGGITSVVFILGVIGAVTAIGLSFMMAGFRQALSGKRSQGMITWILILIFGLYILGVIGQIVLEFYLNNFDH